MKIHDEQSGSLQCCNLKQACQGSQCAAWIAEKKYSQKNHGLPGGSGDQVLKETGYGWCGMVYRPVLPGIPA